MKMKMHGDYLDRFGARAWFFRAACGATSRAAGFRALRGMTLKPRDMDPKYGDLPSPFVHRRCSAEDFAGRGAAETGLEDFCVEAAERGDWCHCIMDGDAVASYGWYATGPVPAFDDTWVRFSPSYVYMYKGFTLPRYRGLQLHAHGMARAAMDAVGDGYEGLISFVEVQNEGSLRSVARLGYRIFGTCTQVRLFGRTFTHRTRGCVPYGFELFVPDAPPSSEWRPSRPASATAAPPG